MINTQLITADEKFARKVDFPFIITLSSFDFRS
jgi:hypothetical protein